MKDFAHVTMVFLLWCLTMAFTAASCFCLFSACNRSCCDMAGTANSFSSPAFCQPTLITDLCTSRHDHANARDMHAPGPAACRVGSSKTNHTRQRRGD